MMNEPLSILTIVAVTFLLAGAVKGMIGLGLPTVAMGMLGLVLPPAEAAALLIVPSFVTNVWQLASGPRFGLLLERLWPMMAGVCLGTWAGAGILASGSSGFATTALGIALLLYALLGLSSVQLRVPARAERWMGPLVGLTTGLVTAATGVFVIPAVPYLQALALEKEELVQALGLSFTVSTVALAAGLAQHGVLAGAFMGVSLLALAPALAGMVIGQWLRHRVRQATFRRCFFLGLLALGAHLALRGVF